MAPLDPWGEAEPLAEPEPVAEPERELPPPEPSRPEPAAEAPEVPPVPAAVGSDTGGDPAASEPAMTEPSPAAEPESVDRDQLRQALSDLTAAKERVKRDAQRVKDETRETLIADLLPVLDNLDRSLQVEASDEALLEGVRLVRAQLEQVLLGYGLERIESVGGPFDPARHEAIAVVEVDSDSGHGMVQAEWQAGYRFGDKVLRAAKVSVGKLVASA